MASNLKVDIVKPTATNGSLSLKGDSGGSATANGISVDSSGNTSVSGQLNAGNIRIDGNTISSTDTNGDITLDPNGTGIVSLDGAVTINESGADVDFRVESDTVDHALFVQGSDGYVGIGVSSPLDKLHVDGNIRLTATHGINFSAYGAEESPDNTATDVTSNTLDDYEEGTFDPTLSSGFSSGPTGYSQDDGTYVKIGRVVYFTVALNPDGATANASQWKMGGLPFLVSEFGGLSLSYQINANTNASDMYHIPATDNQIWVYDVAGNARAGNAAGVNINNLIALYGFYYTT